ncbi:MAG: hypothetical protein M3Y28_11255, partial [Armatimonadota bacterium]|nr:hypothetical protein [Armatimonadota bacterium]
EVCPTGFQTYGFFIVPRKTPGQYTQIGPCLSSVRAHQFLVKMRRLFGNNNRDGKKGQGQ